MAIESEQQDTVKAISVADFLMAVNASLSAHRGRIEGEVTSVKNTYATAVYFTIKGVDQNALLDCVIWRNIYDQNGVDIEVGDKIIVSGTPEVYAPRGKFSLKVRTIEYAGEGALKKEYDELSKKLTSDGLLSIERKRKLPEYPQKIGIITSKSGVVIQDFSSNLGRYGFKTTMVDSRVEGKDAIHEILASIKTLAKQDIEVLVIMRGGGSWESLQAFNTESVVRAIADFKCPVITGIGHDVDVTLAELVADVGSSTPTAVAERLNDSWNKLANSINSFELSILGRYKNILFEVQGTIDSNSRSITRYFEQGISYLQSTINSNSKAVQSQFRSIEKVIIRARTSFQSVIGIVKSQIRSEQRNLSLAPNTLIKYMHRSIASIESNIINLTRDIHTPYVASIQLVNRNLNTIENSIRLSDPAHNLKLGYTISHSNGKLIRSVKDIGVGELIETRVSDGNFTSEIKNVQ